jgi:hypothetical protein
MSRPSVKYIVQEPGSFLPSVYSKSGDDPLQENV